MTKKPILFVTLFLTLNILLSLTAPASRARETKPLNGRQLPGNTVTQGDKPAASLSDLLNPDGTVRTDKSGSFDARGLQMELAANGNPRFVAKSSPEITPTIAGTNNAVLAMALDGNGNVYIGGRFSLINGISANRIAKWNGSNWSALGSGVGNTGNGVTASNPFSGYVDALIVVGGNLYVGGAFEKAYNSAASTIDANNIVMWNGTTWAALGSGTGVTGNGVDSIVYALAASGNNVYVGGAFGVAFNSSSSTLNARRVAVWNGSSWGALGTSQDNGLSSAVYALAVSGSNLYVGGNFNFAYNGATTTPVNNLAVWNGATWNNMGGGVSGSVPAVYALLTHNGKIYVGGTFRAVGNNVTANSIAVWESGNWTTLGNGVNSNGLNYQVFAISASGSNIYVGGSFVNASNSPTQNISANNVAVWNGTSWATLGSDAGTSGNGVNNDVRSLLATAGNQAYVGGNFTVAFTNQGETISTSNFAYWNGVFWSVSGVMTPYASVNDVTVTEGQAGTISATFTITLSAATTEICSIGYRTANNTATAGSDYQTANDGVVFQPGEIRKTVSVSVIGDTASEPDESFFFNLVIASNAVIDDRQGIGTIQDDDSGPVALSFLNTNGNVAEGEGITNISVVRTGSSAAAAKVDFATVNDTGFVPCNTQSNTASSRCDFTTAKGTLDFAVGESVKTFALPIIDDYRVEGNETITLLLSNPSGGTLGANATRTLTVTDNDSTDAGSKVFLARLTGSEQIPSNNSSANGIATLTLNDAETQATITMSNTAGTPFGSPPTAHLHGPASVMGTGPVLFTLNSGNINNFSVALTSAQVQQLKSGLLYLDVHVPFSSNPNGEIRGQLASQPLENARFFVRQHYYDFLSRQPDTAGLDYWVGQIANVCGTDTACIRQRRIEVSAAFFVELEFQQTGSYVYRLYRAAYGNNQPAPNPENHPDAVKIPGYQVFLEDRARVVGGTNLAQSQLALANTFVQRPEFTTRYPASMTAAQYVDALLSTVQSASGADLSAQRDALISLYNSNGRGAVLYRLADDNTTGNPINNRAFITAEYNRAFVLTEYFGYLRRNPDMNGFNFWLNAINNNVGFNLQTAAGQNAMVCSFLTSQEYQERFSNAAPRTTGECPTP